MPRVVALWPLDLDHVRAQVADRHREIRPRENPGQIQHADSGHGTDPGLVYCSISAFGTSAEGRLLPDYDLLVQSVGGLMSLTGTEESGPVKAGVAVVDVLAGLHGLVGVMAALHHRDRAGEGQHVEVSLLGTLLASLVNQSPNYPR
jgi:crotonobetainyl-CoA:carnitine CoA-transferase CaiB-like acyl-CoA transferase